MKMSTLYVLQEGAYLRKEGERIKATYDKKVLLEMPLIKIEQVVLFGPVQVSTQALTELLKRGIEISFLSKIGKYRGRLQPPFSKNSILRRAQYAASFDSQKTLLLAKAFIYGKLANMRTVLRRTLREKHSDILEKSARRISAAIKGLKNSARIDEARGREGEGTSAYFYAFKHLIKAGDYDFEGRERRPPTDPINALLSLGYVLLTNDLSSACNIVGFDSYVGYLHADKYGKPALALDLVEEWRPAMVDLLVLWLINKRMIKADDFEVAMGNTYRLSKSGLAKFVQAYEKKKKTIIKHPVFGYKASYQRCFELQGRILAKFLLGEIHSYMPFVIK